MLISEVVAITDSEELVGSDDLETLVNEETSVEADNESYKVIRVVDGDTFEVMIDGNKETVRVIGINTPETLDPRKPVECFGREASDFAKNMLTGKSVSLVIDPTQDETDKYQRLLRYVTLADGRDYGETMIVGGYAYEYTYQIPYQKQSVYKQAEAEAKTGGAGLWSADTCSGSKKN